MGTPQKTRDPGLDNSCQFRERLAAGVSLYKMGSRRTRGSRTDGWGGIIPSLVY